MSYFTWTEDGLTSDCKSLKAMAARYEEAADLMRRMSAKGFKLKKLEKNQVITHHDQTIFKAWGFINEEGPFKQLTLMPQDNI